MVEQIDGMPEGTLGFRLSGKVNLDEYLKILDPIRERLERGEKVSFLTETAPDFAGLDMGAMWEDLKVAGSLGMKYRSSWERIAVVTDKDWIRRGVSAFEWVIPGEIRVFEPGELEAAKTWTGGTVDGLDNKS